MNVLRNGSDARLGFTLEGRGGSPSVAGKSAAVNLSVPTHSSEASLEKPQSVFSPANRVLHKVKERNGVLMVVFHYSKKMKISADRKKELEQMLSKFKSALSF